MREKSPCPKLVWKAWFHPCVSSVYYLGGRKIPKAYTTHANSMKAMQTSLLKGKKKCFSIFRINSIEHISRKRGFLDQRVYLMLYNKFFSMLPYGLCNWLFGTCIIFHHSCTEYFDHSWVSKCSLL